MIVTADFADIIYDEYTVFLTIDNGSEDEIMVGTELLSVNGFMLPNSFFAEVEAGESLQERMQLYSWDLEQAGIEEIAEISFYLYVYRDVNQGEYSRSELITLRTDIADAYEQPEFLDGWDLYESEDVKIRLVSTSIDSGMYELKFYIENLSEDTLSLSSSAIRVNGETEETYLWNQLRPDTRMVTTWDLYDKAFADLAQVYDISFDLLIEHIDGYEILESRTETIAFAPNSL